MNKKKFSKLINPKKLLNILITIVIPLVLIPLIIKFYNPAKPEFKLNGVSLNPNSIVQISLSNPDQEIDEDIIVTIDEYQVYCLQKVENYWQFYPNNCGLPKDALEDGEHVIVVRISGTNDLIKFKVRFDTIPPTLAIEKSYVNDSSLTFLGNAIDVGASVEDTLNVDILIANGDRFERTRLPVNKYIDPSGQPILAFQVNISNVEKFDESHPQYSQTFCRIQVRDGAKNIAAYELSYSQAFAKGISRTIIGDTEILVGRSLEENPEWKPKKIIIPVDPKPLPPVIEPDEFALVIYVFSNKYTEIGVKNLPPDSRGEITYYRNNTEIGKTEKKVFYDYETEQGGFYQYYAIVSGDTALYKSKSAFSIETEMVYISDGIFEMGSRTLNGFGASPAHNQSVNSFYLGKFEVTQKQWISIMGMNPSYFKGDNLPVENVSWMDCQNFIKQLNKITGKKFRLPTEIEWEYSCRAGKHSEWFVGNDPSSLSKYAWFDNNSSNSTHPVGQLLPNGYGLYDIAGNVFEWTLDLYKKYPINSHVGTESLLFPSDTRVSRGGCWKFSEKYCKSALRYGWRQANSVRREILGFRLAMSSTF